MKLSDIAELNPKRTLKKGTVAPFVEMAALPTNAKNITEITQKTFSGSGSKFKNGDTLFARITPCLENGKTALITELNDEEIAHGSTEFIVISPKNISVDMHYIYYLARLPEFREYARSRMEGTSGRQRVSWQSLAEFEFNFPNEEKRKVIGEKLSLLDEKITLNTQTNQTLEQIAQAIFKHWFIDFAPVHAKANALARGETIEQAELAAMACLSGKTVEKITALKTEDPTAYHQLQQTAQAFPSEFVETEMGQVPKGWEVKPINEICSIVYGKGLPKNQLKSSGYPVYGANGVIGYYDQYLYKTRQVLIGCRGTVGQVYVSQPYSYITSNSLIIEDTKTILNLYFLELYLKNLDLSVFASGSVQPQITIQNLSRLKIFIPNKEILDLFSSLVEPMYQLTYKNDDEKKTLSEIRDFLLPKLLNGEIEL